MAGTLDQEFSLSDNMPEPPGYFTRHDVAESRQVFRRVNAPTKDDLLLGAKQNAAIVCELDSNSEITNETISSRSTAEGREFLGAHVRYQTDQDLRHIYGSTQR